MTTLISLLVVMQVLDFWTTYYILSRGGRELNPLLAKLFDKVGEKRGLLIAKGVGVVIIVLWGPLMPRSVLVGLTLVYLAVIANNLYHVIKIKRTN